MELYRFIPFLLPKNILEKTCKDSSRETTNGCEQQFINKLWERSND